MNLQPALDYCVGTLLIEVARPNTVINKTEISDNLNDRFLIVNKKDRLLIINQKDRFMIYFI